MPLPGSPRPTIGCPLRHIHEYGDETHDASSPFRIGKAMKDAERTNRDTPAALDAIPERYWRNARFLSRTDQEKLLQAHVVIIGLGGLGGTVLEELLRLGIGTITGVDMDVFELSNLNRQLLATEENIGLHKAEAARLRARQINSGVRFIPVTEKQDFGSMCDLFRDADVVVDALGGLADRQALEKAAAEKGVPVVSAGIAGLTGWCKAIFPGETGPASLLAGEGDRPTPDEILGNLAPTVFLAASLQAAFVLQILTGKPVRREALFFDLEDGTFTQVVLDRRP